MAERNDTMRDEYDFSKGVRGKYAEAFKNGSNVVVLVPDVAKKFKTSEEVNEALRRLEPEDDKAADGTA